MGVHRPAIAIPMPVIGEDRIQLLVDAATVDPEPEWLVEWAELAREYARTSSSRRADDRAVSNGEEPGKGERAQASTVLFADVKGFTGNVEGRIRAAAPT
jgi:fatty acid/phospholipid biosynthesis enzyme